MQASFLGISLIVSPDPTISLIPERLVQHPRETT
jgi:hypothetical protein